MISKVYSAALSGIESFRVTIEVDSFPTLDQSFQLVGLPDKLKERQRTESVPPASTADTPGPMPRSR